MSKVEPSKLRLLNNRILIFEHEADLVEVLMVSLSDYVIKTASTLSEAEGILNEGFSPGLIVVDPNVPMGQGFLLLDYIRKMDFIQSVLVMTGDDQMETYRRASQAGVSGVLRKPFREDELRQVISDHLRQSQLMKIHSELVRCYGDMVLGLKMKLSEPPERDSAGLSSALILIENRILSLLDHRENLLRQAAFQEGRLS